MIVSSYSKGYYHENLESGKAAVLGKACRSDVKYLCADVKPGGGRIETCMKTLMADVSEPCKEALARANAGKR